MRVSNLVNIGPKLESLLNEVGIHEAEKLREIGSIEATYLLYQKDQDCMNKLFALEGAIRGVRWHNIQHEEKVRLKQSFDNRCLDMNG